MYISPGNNVQSLYPYPVHPTTAASNMCVAPPTAASSTAAVSRVSPSTSSTISSLFKAGSTIADAATGVFSMIKNWGKVSPLTGAMTGAATGAAIGSLIPAVGTGIGSIVGGAIGLFSGLFKSGKPADQKERDQFRDVLIQNGVIDSQWTIGLADGTRYDIGVDGGPKAEYGGLRPYEVDFNRTNSGAVVGMLDPLLAVATGGNRKLQTSFTGYFTNAALSNAGDDLEKARLNVLAVYSQFKADPAMVYEGLVSLLKGGKISQEEFNAYAAGVQEFFGHFEDQLSTNASA